MTAPINTTSLRYPCLGLIRVLKLSNTYRTLDLNTLKTVVSLFASSDSFLSSFFTDSFRKAAIQIKDKRFETVDILKTPRYPMLLKTGPLKRFPNATAAKSVPSTTASRNVLKDFVQIANIYNVSLTCLLLL